MKKLFLSLIFIMILILNVNAADCIVKEGDCVIFGKYNSEDIVWRVVGETDEEYLLMTENIIDVKSFDVASSRWGTSSLRQWLNSSDGFLSEENFTESELAILRSYTYKTALNDSFIAEAVSGTAVHIYSSGTQGFFNNYNMAFADASSDKVFIPSVADIENILNNPRTFGVDFSLAIPSAELYKRVGTLHPKMHRDGGWYYWLRDAMYGADNNVRCVYPDGIVSFQDVTDDGIGLRPMCCIDKSTLGIASGDGSETSPYRINNTDYIMLYTDSNYGIADNSVNISISTNAADDCTVKVYQNGILAVDNAGENCNLTLLAEDNTFYAEVVDVNGVVKVTSEPIVIYGLSYTVISNSTKYNFDEEQIYSNCEWVDFGGEHGKGLVLASPPSTNKQISGGHFLTNKPGAYIDVDLRFDTMSSGEKIPFYLMAQPVGQFIKPIIIDKSGYLRINDVVSDGGTVMRLEEGRWYNFKIIVNDRENTITIAVDNSVLCKDVKIAFGFDYIQRLNISNLNYASSIENRMCIDNLHVASVDMNIDDICLQLYDAGNNKTQIILVNNGESELQAELILCAYSKTTDSVLDAVVVPVNLNSNGVLNSTITMNYTKSDDTYLKGILIKSLADLEPLLECAVTE